MNPITPAVHSPHCFSRRACILLLAIVLPLAVGGCGSTKVYTADKTIVYRDSIYNLGNVQHIGSRIDGQLPDGSTRSMRGMNRKDVEALLKEHSEIVVSTVVEMDEAEMLYERQRVDRYPDYSKMVKRFDDAMKDISNFMADKKKTQLKL